MSADLTLYFLRHGLADRSAYEGSDDRLRPLTPAGMRRLERQGRYLARLGLKPDLVLSSPLLRARQTADIVARRLGASALLRDEPLLEPGFDTRRLAAILAGFGAEIRRVMLVGHEPGFSTVVGEITGGSDVVCRKAGLARVDLPHGRIFPGVLVWLLPPKAMLR